MNNNEIITIIKDIALPLLVTFITYVCAQHLFKPVSKWRTIRDELIIYSIQYANYVAYSYINEDGKRKFDDRGLINTVEQNLRRMAGEISVLPDYKFYNLWSRWLLPNKKNIEEIKGDLIGWANSLVEIDGKYSSIREVNMESLKKHLGLPNFYFEAKKYLDYENSRK